MLKKTAFITVGLCIVLIIFATLISHGIDNKSINQYYNTMQYLFSTKSLNNNHNHEKILTTYKLHSERKQDYHIQIITSFFGGFPWHFLSKNYFDTCDCKYSCKLIYNTTLLHDSHVVIFHGRNLPDMNDLYNKKPKSQRWGYFILESPHNSPDVRTLEKYFDFSITMSHKSNFQFRPDVVMKLKQKLPIHKTTNYARGKTKMVAWYASNCAQHRIDFLKRLEESGVTVHVGGACSKLMKNKLTSCSHKKGLEACAGILKNFKFYFAAENGFCSDYITEKYYIQGYLGNTIPIVLGAGDYSDPRNAIPNSFINPLDFKNFDEFVAHIKMLDKNDSAYNSYFKWKETWTVGSDENCSSFICAICKDLHERKNNLEGSKLNDQYSLDDCTSPTKRYFDWFKQ